MSWMPLEQKHWQRKLDLEKHVCKHVCRSVKLVCHARYIINIPLFLS